MVTEDYETIETCRWIAGIAQKTCNVNKAGRVFDIIDWEFSWEIKERANTIYHESTGHISITLSLPFWAKSSVTQRRWLVIHEVCRAIVMARDVSLAGHSYD